jgi:hypothetical protein
MTDLSSRCPRCRISNEQWANGTADRTMVATLLGRTVRIGTVGGSGDKDVPGGREEYIVLTDVESGEEFELLARATVRGWGHLLLFER